ncbi:MAG: SIMPL domain-containing protein [Chloroflexota bacterium]
MSYRPFEVRPIHLVSGLLVIALLLVGVLALRTPLAPGSVAQESVIVVSGEGTVEVKPDTATISLGVQRQAKTTEAAITSHATAMNAVIAALKQAGVKDEDIKTTRFSVDPLYDYDTNGKPPVLVGYRVTNIVTCDSQDLEHLGGLIDAAVAAGANEVNGITFTVKDVDAVKTAVIEAAVKDARVKADAIANAAGVKIRRVRSISLDAPFQPPVYYMNGKMLRDAAGATSTPIEAGTNTIRVTVSVTFGI